MDNTRLTRKMLGALGENYAREHLSSKGYRIQAQNWRCRSGEIDLVAVEGELLVFVEVRTRSGSARFGTPQESVNLLKQRQVRETAQYYAHRNQLLHKQQRFDVISVLTEKDGGLRTIEHVCNAF
ncbi:YraN family protein [Paenibacillus xerothermodurans]|uniref:UPF0102 protein CBW46_001405 n=1 Tax=Paenibacillus xerothermodurans TaxID=1977292 RepID=A0A2W1NFK1_PAEXE|nr:YraN family protein [Paenibacillus xerothermodurans]PZE22470.1 YraN family protein [Paenibacillus xerothermodurans]